MSSSYFNYRQIFAESAWERGTFAARWWSMYRDDPHWIPPYYPRFRRELEPSRNEHLERLKPVFGYLEAIQGQDENSRHRVQEYSQEMFFTSPLIETIVALGAGLVDPRRPGTAYLGMLRWVNDLPSLERFVERMAVELSRFGCHRLVLPTGLSIYLGSGLLKDHWSEDPPLHSPYNPPFLPELAAAFLRETGEVRLYQLAVDPETWRTQTEAGGGPVEVIPMQPERLAGDLFGLFSAVLGEESLAPPPDPAEAAFLLRWLSDGPVFSWLALVSGKPAGFIVLQPDYGPALRRWRGGRSWIDRFFLASAVRRSAKRGAVRRGRLMFGGVLRGHRGDGLGRRLLAQALHTASSLGWESLAIGPLPPASPAASFLAKAGAEPRQTYAIYELEI